MTESFLTRTLKQADEILCANDRARAPKQRPDPHTSTVWMFAEIDEACIRMTNLSAKQKRARIDGNHDESQRIINEMAKVHGQIGQMLSTAAVVFAEFQNQKAGATDAH